MPGNRASAIPQIADDASVLQAVFQEKAINRAMPEVRNQISGSENRTSRESGHVQVSNGVTIACA
jgi:hypothetical protein